MLPIPASIEQITPVMQPKGLSMGSHRRMILTVQTERLQTLDQVLAPADGSEPVDFQPTGRKSP